VRAIVLVTAATLLASPGYAQHVEVEVGAGLFGGARLGAGDAALRANEQARRSYRLFAAESEFRRAPAVHLRAAVPLGGGFAVEGGAAWSRPELRTSLSADAEGAAALAAIERIDQYVVDANVVWQIEALRVGQRATPYVSGGVGYLRQLHEGHVLVEHGQVYQAGGGFKYRLLTRASGFVRSTGLRADARLQVLRGGISFGTGVRLHAAVSAGLFVGF
jgi:hypothetical protein